MMKVRVYGDIHQEQWGENLWIPAELEEDKETVLILTGDIWSGESLLTQASHWWINLALQFKHVVMVFGNHDYWPMGGKYLALQDGPRRLQEYLASIGVFNVSILDEDSVEVDGVVFLGATLWTDLDGGDWHAKHGLKNAMAPDMNIVSHKEGDLVRMMNSEVWVETNRQHFQYFEKLLELNREKPVVVVSHHAPVRDAIQNRFKGVGNCYYANNILEDWFHANPNLKMWAFGHTHNPWVKQVGGCILVNNPVGYKREWDYFENKPLDFGQLVFNKEIK